MSTPLEYAHKLVAMREYSVQEFTKKLEKKFPDDSEVIHNLVKTFVENSWLSDVRFCECFIHDALLNTKAGPRLIQQKLYMKGINQDLAIQAIKMHYPYSEQAKVIKKLAQKKREELLRRKSDLPPFAIRQRVIAFIIGKGFDSEMIQELIQ